jgi:glycosyltransferase involved in cell wall biosynthesis
MTTYNHAGFIAEAIEGVMAQKADFTVELLIADDCSNDETEKICREYAERYPDRIRYIRREENIGMMPNFIDLLRRCDGEYIAICEGDDYWIDERKLQKQADFLESHPDYSFCAHSHYFLTRGELTEANRDVLEAEKSMSTEDYMLDPHFQTASYFFRRSAMPEKFPDWFSEVLAGDHFLVLLLSLKGKIGFLNQRMSVFRTSDTSVTIASGPLRIKENFVRHLRIFDADTGFRFHDTLDTVIRRWDLVYKPYEPISYAEKLIHLIKNMRFYLSNFSRLGGLKLFAKYLLTYKVLNRIRAKLA